MPRFTTQSSSLYGQVPPPAWIVPSGAGFVPLTAVQIAALTPDARLKYNEDLRRSQFRELTPAQVLALSPEARATYGADRLLALGDIGQAAEKQRLVNPAEPFIPLAEQSIGVTGQVLLAAINGADLNERERLRAQTQVRLAEIAASTGRPVATGELNALYQTNALLGQQPPVGTYYGAQPVDPNKNLYIIGGIVAIAVIGGLLYSNSSKRSNPVVRVGAKRSKKFIPAAELRKIRGRKSRSRSRSR